jgi:hypothetical protein
MLVAVVVVVTSRSLFLAQLVVLVAVEVVDIWVRIPRLFLMHSPTPAAVAAAVTVTVQSI